MTNLQSQSSNVIEIFSKSKEEKFSSLLRSYKIGIEDVFLSSTENFDIYSIKLSPGSRISKIEKILPEIGLHLQSLSIPRGRMVIEEGFYEIMVQTNKPNNISIDYKKILFNNSNLFCPIILGKDDFGNDFIQDLNQMPNLLVAGATGSGKSVFLHSIILSVAANDANLYLIDPKGVEFDSYKDLDCVVKFTSTLEGGKQILKDLYQKMETIFALLQKKGARNIVEYNSLVKEKIKPSILIIDEWADLVSLDRNLQNELCLVAQKGRAAGISIILATQRPSSSVISGLIKANFPARVSMRVASQVDSRIILDAVGAEKLAKVGSGIYLDPKTGELKHFFAPKIDSVSAEIKKIGLKRTVSFWKKIWG